MYNNTSANKNKLYTFENLFILYYYKKIDIQN